MSSSPFAFLRRWKLRAPLLRLSTNRRGDWGAMALEDGAIALFQTDDAGEDPQIIEAHEGVSLALGRDADNHSFLSGGSDGRLLIVEPHQPVPTPLFSLPKEEIFKTTATREGLRAFATNRRLYLLGAEGETIGAPLDLPESPTGLSFGPRGLFLSLAHGARLRLFDAHDLHKPLRDVTLPAPIRRLLWKRDRSRLYALLADKTLWAWPTEEGSTAFFEPKHFSLPAETRHAEILALSAGDKYLLASCGEQAVAWPLDNGLPHDKRRVFLGENGSRLVTKIAPSPKDGLVALGYSDGAVVLAPLDGRKELVIFPPVAETGARIVGLAWNPLGDCLHAALEDGQVFLFTLRSVTRFVRNGA